MQNQTKNITLTENYIRKGQYGTFCTLWHNTRLKWPNQLHRSVLKPNAPVTPAQAGVSASRQLWLYATPSTRTFGMSIPTPAARVNYCRSITSNKGKYIMLCTRVYSMFNKLHDKKHHQYKPIPLITPYLLDPEQPSPFVTRWALITSTWWPKKIPSW